MKRYRMVAWAVGALAAIAVSARPSKASLLDLSGAATLVTEAAKSAKVGLAVDLNGTREAAYYVGLKPSFFGKVGPFVEACIGTTGKTLGGDYRLLAAPLVNVRPAIERAFSVPFTLPDMWLGPVLRAPSFGEPWTWKTHVGGMLSFRLGDVKTKKDPPAPAARHFVVGPDGKVLGELAQ